MIESKNKLVLSLIQLNIVLGYKTGVYLNGKLCLLQVMRIIDNIRPDRQTVMFSATFPRQMEALARRILNKPIEIQVKLLDVDVVFYEKISFSD